MSRLPVPAFAALLLAVLVAGIVTGFIRYTWTWAGNGYTTIAETTWSAGEAPTRTLGPTVHVLG